MKETFPNFLCNRVNSESTRGDEEQGTQQQNRARCSFLLSTTLGEAMQSTFFPHTVKQTKKQQKST